MIAGNDPNALCQQLNQAKAKGIAIVSFDSDVACRQLFINQANTEQIGRSEVQLLGKEIGYKGQIAILSAASTATNQNAWIAFMQKELKLPKYKNMQLVKIYYGNDNPAQSLQAPRACCRRTRTSKGSSRRRPSGSPRPPSTSTTRSTRGRSSSPASGFRAR